MAAPTPAAVTRRPLPIILVRGFGGLDIEDEQELAYQGFNVGTVYPMKRGENFIYEGFVLRLLKNEPKYTDATNIIGYYASNIADSIGRVGRSAAISEEFFKGNRVVLDPRMVDWLVETVDDPLRTVWVFRYYDLGQRTLELYGQMLMRLIDLIGAVARCCIGDGAATGPKVNIVAHSMGGLIVRQAMQVSYPTTGRVAADYVNKVVTLGTPHQGIAFQVFSDLGWLPADAVDELRAFSFDLQADRAHPLSFHHFAKSFPTDRFLTVVGTNYKTYSVKIASRLNRLFARAGEGGMVYNRSDGLVKISSAQLPGCPRTFIHKCHGGPDSLVTSREAYEVAMRFFHGNVRTRLRLLEGKILRGADWFGKSEFFFGVSVKPRYVDFELFHQGRDAENCYGPFGAVDLTDDLPAGAIGWAGPDRLIWEGFLRIDERNLKAGDDEDLHLKQGRDLVFRVDFYLGERDTYGVGFSDNVVFYKQYYVQAVQRRGSLKLWLFNGEDFLTGGTGSRTAAQKGTEMTPGEAGWSFEIAGTGFKGRIQIELDYIPLDGLPLPLLPSSFVAAT